MTDTLDAKVANTPIETTPKIKGKTEKFEISLASFEMRIIDEFAIHNIPVHYEIQEYRTQNNINVIVKTHPIKIDPKTTITSYQTPHKQSLKQIRAYKRALHKLEQETEDVDEEELNDHEQKMDELCEQIRELNLKNNPMKVRIYVPSQHHDSAMKIVYAIHENSANPGYGK